MNEEIEFTFECTGTYQDKDGKWIINCRVLDTNNEGMTVAFKCLDHSCVAFAPGYFFHVSGEDYGAKNNILQCRIASEEIYHTEQDLKRKRNPIRFGNPDEVDAFEKTVGNTIRPTNIISTKHQEWKAKGTKFKNG